MPTGYTADIADGISFDQFVWNCARAFGALVLLRDAPSGAAIPERFEPSGSYQKSADEARAQITLLDGMTAEEVAIAAAAAHEVALASWRKRLAAADTLREKYAAMLAQAEAWTPPTAEHVGLRDFMLQQLNESMRFDCGVGPQPERLDPAVWIARQFEQHRRMLATYERMHAEEVARTEGRNQWIKALRESVPVPAAKAAA
jgi:hypothetical protein